jgi:hypothetical protein
MKKEKWAPIPGYGTWYEVSNHGRVRSFIRRSDGQRVKREVALIMREQYSEKFAYLSVSLSKGIGRANTIPIHILVALVFVKNPKPNEYKYVNHKYGDKLDNYYEHLEWCTQGQNQKHAYDTGLRKKPNGTLNGRNILTEYQVLEIFNSKENHYKLAAEYGVARMTISHIKQGKIWSSLTKKEYKPKSVFKLTEEDVIKIFKSNEAQVLLAEKYNVSRNVINGIKTGRSYSDITGKKFTGIKEYTYYGLKNTIGRRTQV